MKKKLSYRDKLIELAYIYDVKEIKEYVKSRKSLTTGQLELILKKNKIIIPKDYKSNFFKDTFVKPITRVKSNIVEFKEDQVKAKNRLFRKAENFKHDTKRNINRSLQGIWTGSGKVGLKKPDKKIYQLALQKFHCKPKTTLFIDDRPENTLSANELGIQTINLDRPEKLKEYLKNFTF